MKSAEKRANAVAEALLLERTANKARSVSNEVSERMRRKGVPSDHALDGLDQVSGSGQHLLLEADSVRHGHISAG